MSPVPRAPLLLALAGVLPFLWGVATYMNDALAGWTVQTLGSRFVGPYVGLAYGTVILSFMSGVLWGFAAQATGKQAATGFTLSTLPALWAFFMVGGGPVSAAINLIIGFLSVLFLEFAFHRWGLTPAWWMTLRIPITGLVVACLAVGVWI